MARPDDFADEIDKCLGGSGPCCPGSYDEDDDDRQQSDSDDEDNRQEDPKS